MKPPYPIRIEGTNVVIPALDTVISQYQEWSPHFWEFQGPKDPRVEAKIARINSPDYKGIYRNRAMYARECVYRTGYGPKALTGIVRKALRDLWFVEPWTVMLAIQTNKKFNAFTVRKVYGHRHVIEQYEEDRQYNMIPLGLVTGLEGQDLRAMVGKQCWKRLVHNSVSRNVLIGRKVLNVRQADMPRVINVFSRLPTTLIHMATRVDPVMLLQAQHVRPMNALSKDRYRLLYMLADSCREELPYRPLRTAEDIERHHTRVIGALRVQRRTVLPDLSIPPFEGEVDGVTYRLLRTQQEYTQEGTEMHHCVALFYQRALKGEYVVLSLRGKVKATAGYLCRDGVPLLEQCFGPCNSPIASWPQNTITSLLKAYLADQT